MNCVGYVGGFIFPIITISLIAGVVMWQNYPYLPFGLCIGCFLSSLAGGICPMPMTLACLAIFCFFFGMYETSPIIVATMTSYTLVSGSGLFGALQARAKDQEMKEQQQKEAEEQTAKYGRRVASPTAQVVDKAVLDTMKAEKQKEDLLSIAMYNYQKQQNLDGDL
jgi:H+/gluconate symporter-like permease